ncbi:D-glycerate dehydrogenase [Janthinobacterium sp. 17J80-10]|uniref:2-hydroxyacid dehydrogenase n=1 Tax=Janthinobacterium sp. 17J80-10 TaxID=2497863 RepID=UPI0010055753|nr:D-glycerate dehydrogenase [Janthinobacterium sp. 17J80-10]QAU33921.1 D-glycerate dehydrogenase [Janthinobacterium sp. 17J80-10]
MKPKILIARAIFPEIVERLSDYFEVQANPGDESWSPARLQEHLRGKQGLFCTAGEAIGADLIRACPELRVIANMAVGFNNIDLDAATRAGILVTNTPELLNETTADFAWALLMAAARRVGESERWLRDGQWQRWRYDAFLGADLHGATLGILGMGRIGQAIARRSRGFDMQVLYHNRTPLPAELEAHANHARYVARDDLLARADHLVLVLPYSAATHHAIGAAELALMKPTATLVNIARGGIVDDAALIAALRERRIAAAGLDVFENEPAFHPDFLALDNAVLTPHIGSASAPTRHAMAACAADNLIAAFSGKAPPNLLNPQASRRA